MMIKPWKTLTYLFLLVSMTVGCTEKEASLIRVKGSTTVDPITRKVAEAFQSRRKVSVEVDSTGSHSGIEALIRGDCDIAESSSEASPEYVEKAAEAGVVLKSFLIGHDRIVPIVHPSNPAEMISLKQLHDIYTGKTDTWEPITKHKANIVIVGRNEASGTNDIWKDTLGIGEDITSDMVVQTSNSGVLGFVAGDKNALGYVSEAFLNIEVKPLKIRDSSAEMQVKDSSHPIYRNLYLYVNEKKFSDDIRSFIVFVLSAEGQKLISQLGFTPVSEK